MDRLRAMLANIRAQLGVLTVTQKLLIGTLCVLFLMTLFLVSQYTGSPTTMALLPGGTADDQQKAAVFLRNRSMPFTVATDGKIMVQPDQRYIALAAMTKEQALPGDKKLLFDGLVAASASNWLEPLADKQVKFNVALQNELARVIRSIPGIEDANVVISRPPDNSGFGAATKKAVAQVAVFPVAGQGLDQNTVNALADLVAGSVSGLDLREVAIVDGKNRRSYRAVSPEDLAGGGSYIEQVAKVEKRVQDKVSEHLRFIPEVIVSVNAMIDAARRESERLEALPKGQGTTVVEIENTTSNNTSTSKSGGGIEPGVNANVGMDLNRGNGSNGNSMADESNTVKSQAVIGQVKTKQKDATGRPTKINVTVSVPREYVAAIAKQKKAAGAPAAGAAATPAGAAPAAAAEPSDTEIDSLFESDVKKKIEEMVSPLVETDGGSGTPGTAAATQLVAGTVRAFLIPVSMGGGTSAAGMGGSRAGGFMGGGGGMSSISGLLENRLVKSVGLGALAVVALGMMLMMVKKAGKSPQMPTAEELVGIPPALEPGTDVVGEAIEGETAMAGIEIDEDALKTSKMLEEIGTLVKNNPQSAASVFNRWLAEEE
jgi:flagellar biosynthesis/type III secretory pathway M-ring protein FliF/YscJ